MPEKKANEAKIFFVCRTLPQSTFLVKEFSGIDQISTTYKFDISLISSLHDISPDDLVGKPATLYMHRDGEYFPYSGIVSEFVYGSGTSDYASYNVVLVPQLSLLSLNIQTRVFQKMTPVEIVEEVLKQAGLDTSTEFLIQNTYEQQEYVVQYQESDLNFISRLMEQYGIWYFFREPPMLGEEISEVSSEKLIVTDKPAGFEYIQGVSEIAFASDSGLNARVENTAKESVNALHYRQKAISKSVHLRNYNYRTPESIPEAQKEITDGTAGVVYEYGGNFKNVTEAQDMIQLAANRIASTMVTIDGESNCTGLRAGARFTLTAHPRKEFNTNNVLTSVYHSGGHLQGSGTSSFPTYNNRFHCFPGTLDHSYAPQRKAQKPTIPGIMVAHIEANGSDYATLDEMGRYKVRMAFDTSDAANYSASKYIRLAQPYSGQNYGIHFPSHEGAEMLWACVDGDPNKPIGIGTVPNANTISPVVSKNKQEGVIRTAGGNEIVMDDTDGRQKIFMTTKGKQALLFDDSKKRTVVQSAKKNQLLLDDKNKKVQLNASKHVLTLDYDKEDAIVISTKDGHVIRIDDKKKRLTIQSAKGSTVDMDDDKGIVTVRDGKKKNTVTLDSGKGLILDSKEKISINTPKDLDIKAANIKMTASKGNIDAKATKELNLSGMSINGKASTGDVKLEGLNLKLKGKINASMESGLGTEVKSDLQTKVSGLTSEVSGDTMTTVKGLVVMIN